MTDLPPRWALTRVGDLADVDIGFAFKSAQYVQCGVRLLRGENIEPGALRWTDTRYWPEAGVESVQHLLVRPGDLILAMDRPVISAGLKLARARAVDCPCLLVQRVARLRGRAGTTDFLYHALSSPAFVRHVLVGGLTGTQLPHISGRRIESFQFPLAPKEEQQRVVDAIESYFTRLDDAVVTLERVERNLRRYRASVLKAAVEGRLVPTEAALAKQEGRTYESASVLLERILAERRRRWSESGKKGKYQEPASPDTANLPDLPEGWCWATVDQLACDVTYGSSAKTSDDVMNGIPVIRMGNIIDGYLDYSELKYLPSNHPEFPALLLMCGDLLFNRTNSPELVGKTAVVTQDKKASFASYLVRARFVSDVQPRYVSHFINSPAGRQWIRTVVSQQVGQANVNASKLRSCAIPLPPRMEQIRIVEEVERVFSIAVATAHQVRRDLEQCQRLRQSILKWAFEGKLADQDPSDEAASVLLERINAERESTTIPKTTRSPTGGKKKQVRA